MQVEKFIEAGNLTQASRVRNLVGLVMIEREEYEAAEQILKASFLTADTLADKDFVTLAVCRREGQNSQSVLD